jgi:hypothetical protein
MANPYDAIRLAAEAGMAALNRSAPRAGGAGLIAQRAPRRAGA